VKKTYHQFCGVAKALDVVGERWSLLIVRDLILGGRRYTDLLESLVGITTNLLAQRLRELESAALIVRRRLPPPAGATIYELSELGRALEPVVLSLGAFGMRIMGAPRPGDHTNPRWAMLSLKRLYRGCPRHWTVALEIDGLPFMVTLGKQSANVVDGHSEQPDATLRGELRHLAQWLYRGERASSIILAGDLECLGSVRAARDFVRAFGGHW